jgi:ferrous iron transport protein B
MTLQTALAGLLVVLCSTYAVWSMMPADLRRRLAALRGRPLPAAGSACGGCDGCTRAALAPRAPRAADGLSLPEGTSVVHIVRQLPRG